MDSAVNRNEYYHKEFDPRQYMETYYSPRAGVFSDDKYLRFILANLHKTFSSGDVKGDCLLDIGSGPTIYQIMSACESFEEIIVADLCERNRQEYKRWLDDEPGAFDWSPVGKIVCELEGDRETWPEKEKTIRAKVKQILKCDILESKPLGPVALPQADCLISILCLESACPDFDTLYCALKNMTTLLKTGGHLVVGGVLGCRKWMVGKKEFPGLPLTEDVLKTSLIKCGYVLKELEVEPVAGKCDTIVCDYYGNFFLLAQKLNEVE